MLGVRAVSDDPLIQQMREHWLAPDDQILKPLLALADIGAQHRPQAQAYAQLLVTRLRAEQQAKGGVDALLNEFSLSTQEGIALMCLAEALLRVPDEQTADKLIRDKLKAGDWSSHLGRSHSSFVNASAWALLFTGKLVNYSDAQQKQLHTALQRALGRLGQPVIRAAVRRAMQIMGRVFVMGRTIESAITRAQTQESAGYRYSYDMLGEGARTAQAAAHYEQAYRDAIEAIGRNKKAGAGPEQSAGISVKLSALHPRYQWTQRERVLSELAPRLKQLCVMARRLNIGLTFDAEEAVRLELSLELIEQVFSDPDLRGWTGFGVAVQAYQKRAPWVIDWLAALAQRVGQRIMVRLVKGAYWDSEIKLAQQAGLSGYPVFTRKASTDVCYQACARKLLDYRPHLYPQFATHNAWSVAAILAMDERGSGFEFQRLHGMGEALYQRVMQDHQIPCRIYAPVGQHEDLLAYLVRRLLENGANSSFVNNIVDEHVPIESLTQDPLQRVLSWQQYQHGHIPLPAELYGLARKNSAGFDLSDVAALQRLRRHWAASQRVYRYAGADHKSVNPSDYHQSIGSFGLDDADSMQRKLADAVQAFEMGRHWSSQDRARFLEDVAEQLESHAPELIRLCMLEAGKCLADAQAELREAVDFCRYYAAEARQLPAHRALGVILCISPWNFPMAIFLGQIAGAIAAGNAVLAKPAEQTSVIALRVLELMQQCGLPANWLQCIVGPGLPAGQVLVPDQRVRAVVFTGSTQTGRWLFNTLARRKDAPIPLIAETGGQNAMIVDSTALPEQVVDDVIRSGFQSAGQRCSALRVLYLQHEIADQLIEMIKGAMDELLIANPSDLSSDIGPVIDADARQRLQAHVDALRRDKRAKLHHQLPLSACAERGYFFSPCLFEIEGLDVLGQEVFGPIVHVIRYRADQLDDILKQINQSGYGLTLGIHTRVQASADQIAAKVSVGNVYVNRDMIGAVVGVQPFGGRGLSGTGPKAGGPLYLPFLCRTVAADKPRRDEPHPPTLLSGPTGERNLYSIEPRQRALACYAESDDPSHCECVMRICLDLGMNLELLVPAAWSQRLKKILKSASKQHQVMFLPQGEVPDIGIYDTLVLVPDSPLIRPMMDRLLDTDDAPLPRCLSLPLAQMNWRYFVNEKTISTNITASGGNASLMTMPD